ncbi:MAG: DsbA family protein [Oscillospiraceae bacterium]|jgi:predicted DsbA family dithiol-disulfide isomerase|nr:DsbA family protein [Oscillospiraceae bacterium]
MPKFEIFLDYTCPYCNKGFRLYETARAELTAPQEAGELIPVEAHPRGEEPWHRPYADLAAQGALYFKARGLDVYEYSRRLYDAIHTDKRDPEDVAVLSGCAAAACGTLDAEDFANALQNGEFADKLNENNDYAYNKRGVWAVPTFVASNIRLDAAEGVGVTAEQVAAFIAAAE